MSEQTYRPDASMELLNSILRETIDPDYVQTAGHARRWHDRFLAAATTALAGLMLATSALHIGGTSLESAERTELIRQVEDARQRNMDLRARAEAASARIGELEANGDPDSQDTTIAIWAGSLAVNGPGVRVEVDDSPDDADGIIVDQDMRQVVNALWAAGAEAVAVNGHRLSSRTAIRQAGNAITIDYRSMTTPYRIEAIGDPSDLEKRFETGTGGAWLNFLRRNYRVSWDIERVNGLHLGADPGLGLQVARPR
ncbi:hypothetical protein HMPREF1531_02171 [Propionibacterium sp. oral taxon 192 str. F0372]|uniref:DUF881 domain-containing protein n=1 Tax=Propionibacterium sp. oral taxon 192 TaxID=671222 RepID=UPI000352AB07|nr:DUF881 domain-containing protein [Propionibacterium sp. oral taxon 192]EPH02859.1 hypothetical protein HMPREF1531_02171 [Propionibacterium sp. oral taxon 192 str. F0372]